MLKILLVILAFVIICAGAYFIFGNKFLPATSSQTVKQAEIVATPKPTEIVTVSDQMVADDLTALEKDLMDLEKENNSFNSELNTI